MISEKRAKQLTGLIVFLITGLVYAMTVERTGSLWDCGEFVLAAYKLQVVHPPGAPLFIIVGRMFAAIGDMLSDNPSSIAFAINMMSGLCGAFAATFFGLSTFMLGKIALVGRSGKTSDADRIALLFAGVVGGCCAAFATSMWFSAVEGEVYAMSAFFTAMTVWAMVQWYSLPDEPRHDRWVLFAFFSAAMSIGVHLLSLLTFPAMVLFYYFKKFKQPTIKGAAISVGLSLLLIGVMNKLIIAGIPTLWQWMELFTVNTLGLPVQSGLIPTLLILGALIYFGLRYAHRTQRGSIQQLVVAFALAIVGFSTIGVVVSRSNAHPPVNMSAPTDAMRLLPYLNREQYGERPIMYGPHFGASAVDQDIEERYGLVGDQYEIVDYKITPKYRNQDKIFFPRVSHSDARRKRLYKDMWGISNPPTMGQNIGFFLRYQIGWMYMRYFMWNFAGRQNGVQGFTQQNVTAGNWMSGIGPIDEARLFEMSAMPDSMRSHEARNRFYFIPLLLGLLGMVFHFLRKQGDFLTIMMLFIITGIGITVFANSPPNEPRERDYIFVGSFLTFTIWIGMGVIALYQLMKTRLPLKGIALAALAGVLALSAPILMGSQGYDDNGRQGITAARDYAANFLRGLKPNAILFTYGDNDTYPLWYAQEVEGIRTDVRVINLSLIGVDWYINHQRRKLNESPGIDFTISYDAYRGSKRNQAFFYNPKGKAMPRMTTQQALKFCGEKHPLPTSGRKVASYLPSNNLYIQVDPAQAISSGWIKPEDASKVVDAIPVSYGKKTYLLKGELAVLDIVTTNAHKRPVYFNTTVPTSYLAGMTEYLELDGMALRVVPYRTTAQRGMGIFGYGKMNIEDSYDMVMNQWEWGNFDKEDLFVDDSYKATQQSMRLSMTRLASELLNKNDPRAADVAEKYFEAFPHMNFPYDAMVMPFLRVLAAQKPDVAKKHMDILVNEAVQYKAFFDSQSAKKMKPGRGLHAMQQGWGRTVGQIPGLLDLMKDEDYKAKVTKQLEGYGIAQLKN